MNYTPKQQNKYVNAIVISLIVFGIGIYMLPAVIEIRALFCQITALVCIVAAVFLLVRYSATSFIYSVRPRSLMHEDSGTEAVIAGRYSIESIRPKYLDFVVSKKQGSRDPAMECVLGLDSLIYAADINTSAQTDDEGTACFRKCSEAKSKVREMYKGEIIFYDYTVTLGLSSSLFLLFEDGNNYAAIRIEPDKAMRDYLVNTAKANKEE